MTVGWYVHHHGSGHLQRFLAVRAHLPGAVAFSSLPRPAGMSAHEWIILPLDAPAPADSDPTAGGALHWAPLHHGGLRARMAALTQWVARARPAVFVCDVSVEVALAVRLMGVPVVWIAQRGRRDDEAHRLAYRICLVIAPWSAAVPSGSADLPPGVVHVGALSRFDGRPVRRPPGSRRVSLVLGRGGHRVTASEVRAAARATPDWTWTVAGLGAPVGPPARDAGSPGDPWQLLGDSDVVVGSGGGNLIAEVAAARRPLVCLPQERPFDEQHDGADALDRAALAESLPAWPPAARWPAILARASARSPERWSLLHDGRAGERLAASIRAVGGLD